jgi:putative transcription factor|tara:strand:+ start:31 stop:345 length:315 start_codon:yes stop_codon:yes gene_type:complete
MEHQDWHEILLKRNTPNKVKDSNTGGKKGPSNSLDQVNKDEFKLKKVNKDLSSQIKKHRNSKGLTQKDLAQKINVKPSVINDYESGKALPNPSIINKLKKILEI